LKIALGQYPTQIVNEFRKNFQAIDIKLSILQDRMQMIIDGRRKRELCDWWLALIETECNKFLSDHGYNKDCLPNDYMNKPPKDLNIVKENLELIQNLMTVTPQNLSTLDKLITRITNYIYVILDEFIIDIRYVLGTVDHKQNESLEKDLNYLLRMKEMDEEIQIRRQTGNLEVSGVMMMNDVVPIGGLVMARFHVMECELKTAIELWGPRPNKHANRLTKNYTDFMERITRMTSFQEFLQVDLLKFDESMSEFAEVVLEKSPSLAPQCCIDVTLSMSKPKRNLSKRQEIPRLSIPRHNIQLAYFRGRTDTKEDCITR
jgi:hypothetical protein